MTDGSHPTSVQTSTPTAGRFDWGRVPGTWGDWRLTPYLSSNLQSPTAGTWWLTAHTLPQFKPPHLQPGHDWAGTWWLTAHTLPQFKPPHLQPGHDDWRLTPYLSSNHHTYSRDMMTDGSHPTSVQTSTPTAGTWWLTAHTLPQFKPPHLQLGHDDWRLTPYLSSNHHTYSRDMMTDGSHPTSVQTSTPTAGTWWLTAHTLPQFKPPHLQPGHDDWWLTPYLSSNLHTYSRDMMTDGSHPTSVQTSTPTARTWWLMAHTLPQFKPPHLQPGHDDWRLTPYLSSNLHTYSRDMMTDGSHPTSVQTSTPTAGTWWLTAHTLPQFKPPHLQPGHEHWLLTPYLSSNLHTYSRDMMTDGSHPTSVQTSTPTARTWWLTAHTLPQFKPPHLQPGHDDWRLTPYLSSNLHTYSRDMMTDGSHPTSVQTSTPTAGTWWLTAHTLPQFKPPHLQPGHDDWRLTPYLSSNHHTYSRDMMTDGSHPTSVQTSTPTAGTWWLTAHTLPQFKPPHLQPGHDDWRLTPYLSSNHHTYSRDMMTDGSHPTSVQTSTPTARTWWLTAHTLPQFKPPHLQPGHDDWRLTPYLSSNLHTYSRDMMTDGSHPTSVQTSTPTAGTWWLTAHTLPQFKPPHLQPGHDDWRLTRYLSSNHHTYSRDMMTDGSHPTSVQTSTPTAGTWWLTAHTLPQFKPPHLQPGHDDWRLTPYLSSNLHTYSQDMMTDGSHPTSVQTSTPTAGTWWLTAHTLPQFKPPHLQPGHDDWRLTPYLSSNLHTYSRDMMTDGSHPTSVQTSTPTAGTWWLTAHTLPQFKPPHLQPGHDDWRLTPYLSSNLHTYSQDMMTDGSHPTSVQTSTPTAGTWWLTAHTLPQFKPPHLQPGHDDWRLTPYLSSNLHTYSRDMMTDGSHPTSVQTSTPTAGTWWLTAHTLPQFKPPHLQPGHDDWRLTPYLSSNLHTYSRDMMTDGSHPTSVQTTTPTAGTWWLTAHTLPQFKPPHLQPGHDDWRLTPYLSSNLHTYSRDMMTDCSHPTSVQTTTPTAGTWWLTAHTLPQFKPPHLQPGHDDWRLTPYLSSNLHTYSRDMTDGSHPTSVQTSTPTAGTWWLTAHTLPQFKPPHLQPGHDDWRLTPYLSSNLHTYSRDMMTDGSHPTSVQTTTPTAGTWWLTAHTLPQFKTPPSPT